MYTIFCEIVLLINFRSGVFMVIRGVQTKKKWEKKNPSELYCLILFGSIPLKYMNIEYTYKSLFHFVFHCSTIASLFFLCGLSIQCWWIITFLITRCTSKNKWTKIIHQNDFLDLLRLLKILSSRLKSTILNGAVIVELRCFWKMCHCIC